MSAPRVRLGDLSVGFVQALADALLAAGVEPAPLLEQYGLDQRRLAEPGARLSIPATCVSATLPSSSAAIPPSACRWAA